METSSASGDVLYPIRRRLRDPRAGRDATEQWLDIATTAMDLPADTVLDGVM